jgi:hypothetical protein
MLLIRTALVAALAAGTAGAQLVQQILTSPGAQTGPPQTQEQPLKDEAYCTVEGVVIDARTQAPLRKASVVLVGGGEASRGGAGALSDASGRFVFERVPPGRYQLTVRRNGYASAPGMGGGGGNPATLTLAAGQHLKGIVLRLQPAAVITGRVIDEDGEPLAYARISAMQYRYVRGKRQLVPSGGGATTDDRGEYRMFGLTPGRYYISAAYEDRQMGLRPLARARSADRFTYPAMYFPGVLDPEQAVAVQMKAGEERSGIDFRLSPAQAVSVSGRVIAGGTGRPGRDVAVMIIPRTNLGFFGSVSRRFQQVDPATGRFTIPSMRPGSYVVTAFYRGQDNALYARQEIEVGSADIEGIELVLAPGITLQGRVEIERGGADLIKLDGTRVFLQPEEDMPLGGSGSDRVADDGAFQLRNLSPGRFTVRLLRQPDGGYLKAARLGDQDVLSGGLMLHPGSAGGTLHLVVSPFGGQVDGVVLDQDKKPFAGAAAVLVPEESKRNREDLFFQQSSDQDGRFSFRGVPPGDYKVFAWDKIEFGVYRDPAFLERYEDEGVKVSVKERSQEVAELKLLLVEEAGQ